MTSDKEDDEEEELRDEIKKLNKRIRELEGLISQIQRPFEQIYDAAKGYYKFIDLYMKYGEVSPEIIVPELKDPISKEIISVLFEKNGQNTSQITEAVRERRGSASRRIVRQKLAELEKEGLVVSKKSRKSVEYYISEELVKKWSQVLSLNK
jgi:DNA-binding transcriptional ArsR family regulator